MWGIPEMGDIGLENHQQYSLCLPNKHVYHELNLSDIAAIQN